MSTAAGEGAVPPSEPRASVRRAAERPGSIDCASSSASVRSLHRLRKYQVPKLGRLGGAYSHGGERRYP
jgi:hypothetical protein